MAEKASSSFLTSEYAYDIFLSFRGEDTRKTFTIRLFSALKDAGFSTFIDDNGIERGEDIKSELIRAIRHSRGSIVVLSENYANSGWCLDELALIVENRKSKGHIILPIFYYVSPSQVGRQMDSFAEAFDKYEERFMEETDELKKSELMGKAKKWRAALTAVAELGGMIIRSRYDLDGAHDTELIKKIITIMEDKLNRAVLSGAPSLIGINSRVTKINLWIQDISSDVNILVICGVGGIGKTTIAKFAYNLNFERFQRSIFIPDVRQISERNLSLVHLQEEFLSYIGIGERKSIKSVEEGIYQIENALRDERFLLVMDDIDRSEQVYAILGKRNWFRPGTKVIITTRREFLLKPDEDYKLVKAKPLDDYESSQLFSWYAFGQDHPIATYEAFAKDILHRCGGLPLALKVLGSSLSGRSLDVWKDTAKKLEEITDFQIMKLLKISYDSLVDDHDRNLFLHVACFFVGETKNHVTNILDECNYQTMVGLQNLIDRCLIAVDGNTSALTMHQLVQDMGRDIVRRESPRTPGKRTRLWHNKDSFNVLKEKTGTEVIEGLLLDMKMLLKPEFETAAFGISHTKTYSDSTMMIDEHQSDIMEYVSFCYRRKTPSRTNVLSLEMDTFEKMHKLRLLRINFTQLNGSLRKFPNNLRWLCWRGFPLNYMPDAFPLETIVVLDMTESRLKRFCKKPKVAECLKILNLSHSSELVRTPSFTGFPNLETLKLNDCLSLYKIHKSIGTLKRLVLLDLQNCISLRKLPKTISMLKFLETLNISGCLNLEEFPLGLKSMTSLKMLSANGIAERDLDATDMDYKDACFMFLTPKPRKIMNISWDLLPNSLVSLSLVDCNLSDDAFPRELSCLQSLEVLNLSQNSFCYLPDFVRCLSRLKKLSLNHCWNLISLLDLPDIRNLNIMSCDVLETITHGSASSKVQLIDSSPYCQKLSNVEGYFSLKPIAKIRLQMLNTLGFSELKSLENAQVKIWDGITLSTKMQPCQVLYEFGIFSTSVPGKEIPNWFNHKCSGSAISFTLPSILTLQPHSLHICFSYAISQTLQVDSWSPEHQLFAKVTNCTKNLTWIYNPTCFGIPDVDQELLWLSHWTVNGQVECGDELDVLIVSGDSLIIKECGINVVYHELDVDVKNTYLSWKEIIGGDLSAYQLSTGAYFLCRTYFLLYDKDEERYRFADWTTTKWGRSLLGGSVDFREVGYMNWRGRDPYFH